MAQLLMYHHRLPSPTSIFESQAAPGKSVDSLRIEKGIVPVSPIGTSARLPNMEVTGMTYSTRDCMRRS
jgi:hypothetical protein